MCNTFHFLTDSSASKVSDSRIIIAIDPSRSDLDDFKIPDRCRVLKLANSITYDREVFTFITLKSNETFMAGWKER
jgi:hypothetical protein